MNTTIPPDFDDKLTLAPEALPLAEPTASKFTEEMALDWLTANANSAKPVREIAALWGWHRSRVQRFLSRFRETSGETKALSRSETGETAALSRETAETAEPKLFDFDWSNEEVLVVPPQPALAAYFNRHGQIVIRADRGLPHVSNSEDVWIVISPASVPKLINKLNALLAELEEH